MNEKYILVLAVFFVLVLVLVFVFKPHPVNKSENQTSKTSETENLNKAEESNSDKVGEPEEASDISDINDDLKIEVLKQGAGETATSGDEITVHYTGYLLDGTKFDSSIDRGQPFSFILGKGQVIKGWDQGLLGANIGEKLKLTIPPSLGYGAKSIGPIPANSTLIFEVEVLGIK